MDIVNRIKIEVAGSKYVISTAEPSAYVLGLARELDEQLHGILEKNETMSINDGLVLCALNYIDYYKKAEESADRLRLQLSEYLEDAARARIEVDEARREVERLKKELSRLSENSEHRESVAHPNDESPKKES